MKFEKTFTVGAREMGISNKITNYGILAFLEDVASNHSDTVGYGVKDIPVKKKAWFLMDWDLEVFSRPSFGKRIYTKTWATKMDKPSFHVYRHFEVLDENNKLVAKATTKWVFFDTENNKIVKIDDSVISLYNPEGSEKEAAQKIKKLREPASFESVSEYEVKRADIDINRHVHNLNYLNIAYEALPENVYNAPELNHVHIMYKHQIKLGDIVKCFYSFEDGKHFVTIKSEDENTLHAIVELY